MLNPDLNFRSLDRRWLSANDMARIRAHRRRCVVGWTKAAALIAVGLYLGRHL